METVGAMRSIVDGKRRPFGAIKDGFLFSQE